MSKIRSKNTKPELIVRSIAHRLGYRFRLHRRGLPGSPDLVLPRWQAVVFVHGCYWHGHGCRRGGTGSKSNTAYWGPKIERTRDRDAINVSALQDLGWSVLTIWECEVEKGEAEQRLLAFLPDKAASVHDPGLTPS